ncbi:hypothetical protein AMS68_005514 [Peltaster fructicola]|uniref:C3H1-type domain-containing protein n=1 Tax=Peltaster fructicola TaxID=286661 RepID=A0A6H0XZ20_9PEZI|nr:hypothetical protein AMS68_005514 [Peltaster fructicola]
MDHNQQQQLYPDGNTGDSLLQYSQGFNASDNLFPHPNDQNDAGWGVNASAFSHSSLSRATYQNNDWGNQQHAEHLAVQSLDPQHGHNQGDAFRQSSLQNNPAFNAASFNNYSNHAPYNYRQPQFDPSLLDTTNQAFKHYQSAYPGHTHESRTIEPQALEHEAIYQGQHEQKQFDVPSATAVARAANLVDHTALAKAIPVGKGDGIFHTIDFDQLVRATNSERMSAFSTIAREPQEWDSNRAALPAYVPRKSKNALKRLAGQDGALLAKINQKSIKRARLAKPSTSRLSKGGDAAGVVKSQQYDDSSDDDSEYTSESDVEDAPLPIKRPDTPREAIEYDTIKALWRSKRKAVDANDVRKGLVDFWELVKTVRDRWKTDAAVVVQAEEKKLKGELPLLRQRVKDQRDMIECAFKTALKHGNRTILETLSENASLLFLCYQFLLDRFKAEDVNGSLARSILEVMALFTTLTSDKLEKTHLVKILPRYAKAGDAKTQFYARSIVSKATAGADGKAAQAKTTSPSKADSTAGTKRAANGAGALPPTKKPTLSTIKSQANAAVANSTKKRLLGDDAAKPAAKKVATTNGVTKGTSDDTAAVKKPTASKLTTGLFAGLSSAVKKPGTSVKPATATAPSSGVKTAAVAAPAPAASTAGPARSVFSFAETMKNLTQPKEEKPAPKATEKDIPDETPEQKARRKRREARGPLRVHWKSQEDLLEIREFTHDPDEEQGHDSSQTRDVADLQGEGRMFKQQHNKIMDDDDDEPVVEVPMQLIDWYEPMAIDFAEVPKEERDRNYFPFGGGDQQPDSAENAERKKYEDNTLMVFYSHSDDIPATPREPDEAITGEAKPITAFAAPEQKYIDRAAHNSAARQRRLGLAKQQNVTAPIDFDSLRHALGMQQAPQPQMHVPPPAAQPVLNIQAILAQLGQPAQPQPPTQASQPAPFMQQPSFPAANPLAAFFAANAPQPAAPQPPAPPAQPDISAILAQLNQTAAPVPQPIIAPPAMPSFPPNMDPGLAFLAQHHQQQKQQQGAAPAGNEAMSRGNSHMKDKYKSKVCKYWQEGTCTKGDNCTYRHE